MKTSTLIDTNILIEVWGPVSRTASWASGALTQCRRDGALVVSPLVWSEIAPMMHNEGHLDAFTSELGIEKEPVPWSGAFQAGVVHARYRKAGGTRERTLPDFLIGAHALVGGHRLLTRDASRYRTYFPDLEIIAPDTHP